MFIETKFDCHILHSVSKGEKLEHIAHSYASCSFIFPKEHHLLFGGRLHASEGSNYFNQCCALCSYNGMHYPFSRNGVHVESPCESNTSRDAAVSSRERAKRERERERPPSSKNVATLCKIPLHTDSIFIGWFCLKLVFKANLLSVPSPCLFLVSNLQSFKAMQKPWDAKQIFYNPCPKMPQVIFDVKMHQFCYKSHHSQHSSRVGWKFHRNPAFLIIYLEAPNIIKHHSLQVVSKFPEFFATFCSFIPLPELLFAKNLTTMLSLCFLRKLLVSFPVFLDKNMSSTVRTWNFICPWRA